MPLHNRSVQGFLHISTVTHKVILERVDAGAIIVLGLRSGQKLSGCIIGKCPVGLHDLVRECGVLVMLAVMAVAMRIEVVMSAVLMPSVMLVIVGITCQRFDGGLPCDESPVVISIEIVTYHPLTGIADILKLHDLIPCIVSVIGADAVRAVDPGHPVNGIISIGGNFSLPVGHFDEIVVLVILIAYFCAIRIGNGS